MSSGFHFLTTPVEWRLLSEPFQEHNMRKSFAAIVASVALSAAAVSVSPLSASSAVASPVIPVAAQQIPRTIRNTARRESHPEIRKAIMALEHAVLGRKDVERPHDLYFQKGAVLLGGHSLHVLARDVGRRSPVREHGFGLCCRGTDIRCGNRGHIHRPPLRVE